MDKITLPDGLGLRLAKDSDKPFLAALFHSTRHAFYLAEQEADYIRTVIEQQQQIQQSGYENQSPNAMTFIIDKLGTAIGRLVLDFGSNTAHIVDISLIPEARGKGYGAKVIQAVQHIAHKQGLPVGLTVETHNTRAKQLYLQLGFAVEGQTQTHELMYWYPQKSKIFV